MPAQTTSLYWLPLIRILLSALLCLSVVGQAEPQAEALENNRPVNHHSVSLKLNPVLVFSGRGEVLAWSRESGYLLLKAKRPIPDFSKMRGTNKKVMAKGTFTASGNLLLESLELLDEILERPPTEPLEFRQTENRIARHQVEGVVRNVIDRGYLLEAILEVNGLLVGVLIMTGNEDLRSIISPGNLVRVKGYQYSPFRHKSAVSVVLTCQRVPEIEQLSAAAAPEVESVTYQRAKYVGNKTSGEKIFFCEEPPISVALSFGNFLLVDWDFNPNFSYELSLQAHDTQSPLVNAHWFKISETKDAPNIALPEVTGFSPKPRVGSTVNFTGRLTDFEIRDDGDMQGILDALEGGEQIRIFCKHFRRNWPTLNLSPNVIVEATGMYQGDHEISGTPELFIREWEGLVVENTSRNWMPALLIMGGVLMLSFLWVTFLRRLVRKRTREARASEAKLMAVYQSVPHGMIAVDDRQQIFGINQALASMFGLSNEHSTAPFHVLREAIGERMRHPEKWQAFVDQTKTVSRAKQEFFLAGSPTRSVEVQMEPIVDQQAKGQIWLFQDLTEKRKMEHSLAQSSKLEAIGRLTGGIAHDFNNLLTGVTGNLSMLEVELQEGRPTNDLLEYAQGASTAADHAAKLVRQLMDYSKQTTLEVQNISANEIVVNLYDLLRHSVDSRITFDIKLADDLHPTRVDPTKIEQVLMNLVINAIDAMPDGGEIRIATSNSQALNDDEDSVTIVVSDSGCGIAPEVMEDIFEPYFTTKAEDGNGLGLSTSLAIVEQHGGTLNVDSTPGEGTTFTAILPANQEPATTVLELKTVFPSPEPWTKTHPSGRKKIVVAIDDEPTVLRLIRAMLSRLGCQILTFPNGQEAVDHLRSIDGRVDLIVSDNSMPIMDGLQTFAAVRAAYPEIPFIVCSGYLIDLSDYAARAHGSSPEGFIQKPLHVHTFTEMVQDVLKKNV